MLISKGLSLICDVLRRCTSGYVAGYNNTDFPLKHKLGITGGLVNTLVASGSLESPAVCTEDVNLSELAEQTCSVNSD